MKRPGSDVHVFELVFEHMEDILNHDFSYVWCLHTRIRVDRHVFAVVIVDTSLWQIQALQSLLLVNDECVVADDN